MATATMIIDNASGRHWQRVTLALSLGASLAANIGHTLLAASAVPVWFRMVGAVWWPLITFLAVEVLIRTVWDTEQAGQRWARRLILFPVLPAAVTSYEHMRAVLLAMGEREFIADFGPLAVDVAMVGCAMALLFTRSTPGALQENTEHLQERIAELERERLTLAVMEQEFAGDAPVSPAPILPENTPERPARLRGEPSPEQADAVEMLLAGKPRGEIVKPVGPISGATYGRLSKVWRMLRENPHQEIDPNAEKVHPKLIDVMRERARAESTR